MSQVGDETYLESKAREGLAGETIEAAGIFGLHDLVWAQVAGGTAGGVAGGTDAAGEAVGTAAGGRLAKEEAARALGLTVQLLVVVTPDHIVVTNWEAGGAAGQEVLRLDRASAKVEVKRMGLGRIVTLGDPESGREMHLSATVAPFRPQSGPDRHVLTVLAGETRG
jgi:hypothetical protein